MTDTYYSLFVVLAICSGLLFIGAAAMFFLFNIPKIIGHLTGYTARKQIKQFQSRSASVNEYSNHLDTFMEQQRDMADKVKNNVSEVKQSVAKPAVSAVQQDKFNVSFNNNEPEGTQTLVLETTPLSEELKPGMNKTRKFIPNMPETSILEPEGSEATDNLNDVEFNVIFSLDFINTDEVI